MPTDNSEKDLLLRIGEDNQHAFTLLYEQYRHKVSYVAFKMLHSEEDVKDVLQDIYSKIWQNRKNLSRLESFPAYLITLTRNHIYDRFRKKASEDAYIQQLMHKNALSGSVFNEALYNELLTRLREAAQKLPAQQRQVFELSKMEGLKQEEIAICLGISRETVKKHLKEALKKIFPTLPLFSFLIVQF